MSEVFLISNHEQYTADVRKILLREGLDCPANHVLTLETAEDRLAGVDPDLILVILEPDPLLALQVVERIPKKPHTHILVLGPAADPKLVISALRGQVNDYVDLDSRETELSDALVKWSAGAPSREEGKLIVLLGPSGGSGSSTLAVNVATVLGKQHKRAALIDMKLQSGDLPALLDLKPTHTLSDLCQSVGRLDRTLLQHALVASPSGVHLLAAPRTLADVQHVNLEGVRQIIGFARSLFPYVVVDLDHSYREEQVDVLRKADVILIVLRLEFAALRNTRRTLEYLDSLRIPRDKVRLVVNRHGQPKEVPAAKAEEALGMRISHYIPDDPKSVIRANNNGVPVVLESPGTKVSKSLDRLAASVNGRDLGGHKP